MIRQCLGLLPLVILFISGCQSASPIDDILEGRRIDYEQEDTQKQQRLQYPPDLLSTARSVEGTVSLSEYTIASVPTIEEEGEVAIDAPAAKVSYRRNGNLRWVEVELTPNEAWGLTRGFWEQHLNFVLAKQNAELGVMETDWLNLRERVATPGWLGSQVDDLLNRLNDSGVRDKFITRLERNQDGGTDIYIAHRFIAARFDSDGLFSGYENQQSSNELEIELMRRMMLYFAKRNIDEDEENDATDIDAQIDSAELAGTGDYLYEGTTLVINKPFHESWQLVQVGLNRGGFSIEDRDYQEGVIYIRHSGGPDSDKIFGKAETSFFNRLFGEEKPILRDIKLIFNHQNGDVVYLTTEAVEEDSALTELQSGVVLELLHQYLP